MPNDQMREIIDMLKVINANIQSLQIDVTELKSDVGVLKTDVGELKSDVGELKSDVCVLKSDVGVLKTDVSELKTDLGKLQTDFTNNESNFKKAGTTYELIVLQSLREKHGLDYARSFTVENLHGLARLALPKDVTYSGNKFSCHKAPNIPIHDVDKVHMLATHAHSNYGSFSSWLTNNEARYKAEQKKVTKAENEWKMKYKRAKDLYTTYSENGNEEKKILFLKSSPLGLWMFSIDSYEGYLSIIIIVILYYILP